GSLYAHYTRFVSPEVFLFSYTVTMVIMVVAGGKGTLAGPLVGALIFTVLPEALRAVVSWQWQMLAYGVLLVLLVVFLPRGIVPSVTVADKVMTGLRLRGAAGFLDVVLGRRRLAAEESRLSRDADGIIDFVGLGHRRAERASELPYGEQRLVELAVALGARPR